MQLALNNDMNVEPHNFDDLEEPEEELPRWGHWVMPQKKHIDQELHHGEFMQLNDLMAPMEDGELPDGNMEEYSNITIS